MTLSIGISHLAERVVKNRGTHVIDNLRRACETDGDILIRVTVIPGFNSRDEDMEQFAELFSALPRKGNIKFELLYYHTYGRSKWDAIGQEYRGPEEDIPDSSKAGHKKIFESFKLSLVET